MTNFLWFFAGSLFGFLIAWQLVKHRLWKTFINEVLEDTKGFNIEEDTILADPLPENEEES